MFLQQNVVLQSSQLCFFMLFYSGKIVLMSELTALVYSGKRTGKAPLEIVECKFDVPGMQLSKIKLFVYGCTAGLIKFPGARESPTQIFCPNSCKICGFCLIKRCAKHSAALHAGISYYTSYYFKALKASVFKETGNSCCL